MGDVQKRDQMSKKDWLGKHVNWTKVKGPMRSFSMPTNKGFGCLGYLELGRRMVITGDYGFSSSPVRTIKVVGDALEVMTENSVYLIEKW